MANKSTSWGFNAFSEEYEDLVKAGVIDPVKVVRSALENAASVAALMLTTETMIADAPKKDLESAPGRRIASENVIEVFFEADH